MAWEIEFTDQFNEWWLSLTDTQQEDLAATVELMGEKGTNLPGRYSKKVLESCHNNMRELRTQSGGRPLRTFYALDPRGVAILLIGADKGGNDRFYKEYVRKADNLYDQHLDVL